MCRQHRDVEDQNLQLGDSGNIKPQKSFISLILCTEDNGQLGVRKRKFLKQRLKQGNDGQSECILMTMGGFFWVIDWISTYYVKEQYDNEKLYFGEPD